MHTNTLKQARWGFILTLLLALGVTGLSLNFEPAAAQASPGQGMVCTTNPNSTFTLTTETGYIGTPDDNVVYMWGFSESGSPFQHPSPVLCVKEGDTVTIILHNTLPEDVSITFPGQENVLANGEPVQPQFDTAGKLTSLTNVAPATANGGSVTYSFVANKPGTFIYQSGTNPAIQVRMGLFGVLVVRPVAGDDHANNRTDSQFNPETEYLTLFSEIDPYLNHAIEIGRPFNLANYKPRYWMINGRGFPDTVADNFASWLPSQPYGSLARVQPYDATDNPGFALERFVNVGTEVIPMHPHSKNVLVVGRDGNPVEGPNGEDLAWENYSIPVGPGETFDTMFQWHDSEHWDATTNPIEQEITIPGLLNTSFGAFYGGSPYLGTADAAIPVGTTSLTSCGEYYLISHNHALYQITAWGVPMSGPITYMRVDPPTPNDCQ